MNSKSPPFHCTLTRALCQINLDKCISTGLIVSIIGSCATLIYVMVKPSTGERFTEFYLLGSNGIASDYPTVLNIGDEGELIIGIVNHEYKNITYHLEVIFNGFMIHEKQNFLIDKETCESAFTFKATEKGENQKLEVI